MHADEIPIDDALARRLADAQFPEWASLPLSRAPSDGTDNIMFRLGDRLALRMPRRPSAAAGIEKELQWLPRLAPSLPLPIPAPVAAGRPSPDFPWPWSICRWIDGARPDEQTAATDMVFASDLAEFVAALHTLDAAGGPAPGAHNAFRGCPLADRDGATRRAIASLRDKDGDAAQLLALWEAALSAPVWTRPPVWIHGDLYAPNLLQRGGRLCGVLDFGCLGVGDPACDLAAAWTLLGRQNRSAFRDRLRVDDAAWSRGLGWALSIAVIQLPYYRDTNPTLADAARRTIREVLAGH
ncbi:MAG: aminoglycoside phosphotransferase family protein [Pseudomonadota bacterium]